MNACNGRIAIAPIFAAYTLSAGTCSGTGNGTARADERPSSSGSGHRAGTEPGAVVRGLSVETENGQTFYEVSLKIKGRIRNLLIDANGTVEEIEDQVTLASLPPAARAEIVKQVDKGRILIVESI
jgi:hypothetical protein